MSSKLKLTGLGGGDTILQGNDSITTDQTFTLPDNGGEIVTAPAGGSVVGYQQGIWTPKMGATNGDSTHTYTGTVGIWTRIGNQVTIHFQAEIATLGSNGTGIAGVTGLPYIPETTNSYSGVINYAAGFAASYNPVVLRSPLGGSYEGFAFYKYELSAGHSNVGVGRFNVGTVVSANATYITDDATWTPINGATLS
jgi:hypothetical protein